MFLHARKLTLICIICLPVACFGQDKQRPFQIRFTPGLDFAHLTIANSPEFRRSNLRIGGELEVFLPFQPRKWGFFLEPAFQSFSEESAGFRYESIETSLGIRYHVLFKNKGAFFVNLMSLVDAPITHSQRYSLGASGNIVLKDDSLAGGFAGGAGITFGLISVEGRLYSQRIREGTQLPIPYRYGKVSMILGIRLF
ncbi:MAG TPA: hypothetical protein VK508_07840 [Cyclobacteriaceae bacterium]|nr:hypothetical protein [Cyclobacteriaceae bacterium]